MIQVRGLQISWNSKRTQQINLEFVKHLCSIAFVLRTVVSTSSILIHLISHLYAILPLTVFSWLLFVY